MFIWILCVVSSGASYWSPALSSLLWTSIYLVHFSEIVFLYIFLKMLKKQSRQDEPVKSLPGSGAALMKSQKIKGVPWSSLECIEHINHPGRSWNVLFGCFLCSQEYEIDKTLGIKGPEDVAKMGIEAYNKECRGIVMRYAKEWEVSEGSVHVLLSISKCVCVEVFQVGWTSSFCLIVCINLMSWSSCDAEKGTKRAPLWLRTETAVLSREGYLQVAWSSECLMRYTEQIIDMLSIVCFFVSSLV